MAILTRRRIGVPIWTLMAALLVTVRVFAQAGVADNDIKAAFLYNFAKYVAWPETAFASGDFRVCVVGVERPFLVSLDAIIAGETVAGRPVSRQTPTTIEAARLCHILFVGRLDLTLAYHLIDALEGAPVLLVADDPDFLDQGGMVTFVRDQNRIRFDVDVSVAEQAGLMISSRMLRVARRVISPEPRLQ